jgi:hypothetical protein
MRDPRTSRLSDVSFRSTQFRNTTEPEDANPWAPQLHAWDGPRDLSEAIVGRLGRREWSSKLPAMSG